MAVVHFRLVFQKLFVCVFFIYFKLMDSCVWLRLMSGKKMKMMIFLAKCKTGSCSRSIIIVAFCLTRYVRCRNDGRGTFYNGTGDCVGSVHSSGNLYCALACTSSHCRCVGEGNTPRHIRTISRHCPGSDNLSLDCGGYCLCVGYYPGD